MDTYLVNLTIFNKQHFHQYSFAKKVQTQTVNREKLHKTLSYKKVALKMLVKWTPNSHKMSTTPSYLPDSESNIGFV